MLSAWLSETQPPLTTRMIAAPLALVVGVKTFTPNFKEYEVQFDGGPWKTSADKFDWMVGPGANRMAVRTVNQFGVRGPVSTAEIELAR